MRVALLLALLAVVAGGVRVGWQKREPANRTVGLVHPTEDNRRSPSNAAPAPPMADPVPPQPLDAPTLTTPERGAARVPVALPPDIQQTVTANLVPGRMVFLDFTLDRNGLRVTGATGAAGRAKPEGTRVGFGFVHYEVFGVGGERLLSGSIEDPTRRRLEHPANSDDGRISSTVQFAEEGPLAVRLPGEVAAARISFFRDRNPLAPTSQGREHLGEFLLRPQP